MEETSKNFTMLMSTSLLNQTREYCSKHNTTVSALIRKALEDIVKKNRSITSADLIETLNFASKSAKKYSWKRDDAYDAD